MPTRMLSTPPRLSRWNSSVLGVCCGTTPQKLPGNALAGAAASAAIVAATASAATHARSRCPRLEVSIGIGLTRLGRDRGSRLGRAVMAAAVHHRSERDRRKHHDRDQDRHQRRRTSILFARRGRLDFVAQRLATPDAAVEVGALATLLAGAVTAVLRGPSGPRR